MLICLERVPLVLPEFRVRQPSLVSHAVVLAPDVSREITLPQLARAASARGLNGPAKEGKVLCSLLPTYDARSASKARSTPAGGATTRRRSGRRRLVARIHRLWRSPLTLSTEVGWAASHCPGRICLP
jgi:hypothetical protein